MVSTYHDDHNRIGSLVLDIEIIFVFASPTGSLSRKIRHLIGNMSSTKCNTSDKNVAESI